MWSLVITVAAELIALTATIVGAPSLAKLTQSAVPLQYFIESTSNNAVYDVLSVGVVLAILNAVIAIILSYARILWSAARDRAFPGPVSGWMAQIHPRWRSPWLATAFIGVLGAVLCLTVSLGTLVNLTGASLVADYALIAIAAPVARPVRATEHSPYRMPWWPLPPLLALASLGYVFTQQTALLLRVTLITMALGLMSWLAVILPQRGRAWHLLDAAAGGAPAPEPAHTANTAETACPCPPSTGPPPRASRAPAPSGCRSRAAPAGGTPSPTCRACRSATSP